MNKFINNFTNFFFLQKTKNKKIFICDDFDIDLIKSENNSDTNRFLDLVFSYGQYPLITKPTRIANKNSTSIDNIFINFMTDDIISNILIDDIKDHLPVLCILPKPDFKYDTSTNVIQKRKVNVENLEMLKKS